jgi:hypothetical protein
MCIAVSSIDEESALRRARPVGIPTAPPPPGEPREAYPLCLTAWSRAERRAAIDAWHKEAHAGRARDGGRGDVDFAACDAAAHEAASMVVGGWNAPELVP